MKKEKPIAEIKDGKVYILQTGTPVYVKTADLCSMIGKSNQWVGQLVSQGTLHKKQTPKGALFELHEALKAYIEHLEDKTLSDDFEEVELDKKKSDASWKKARATIATLDAKERLGKMHRSEDVAAMTEDLIFAIRGALLALPGRLAVDVVEAKDTAEASSIIRDEIYHVMEELSNYQYDSAKYQERVRERLRLEELDEEE